MAFAYAYGRSSTAMQAVSIEVQEEQCRKFYEWRLQPQGIGWGNFYKDTATSGGTDLQERESGSVLLSRLQHGDHLIFAKMDRAFRSMTDQVLTLETLRSRGVNVHFLDAGVDASTPTGKLLLDILASFAEFERKRISERTKESAARRLADGLAWGNPPYGFKSERRDGKAYFVWDHDELAMMKRVWELRNLGHPYMAIRQQLRVEQVFSRTNEPFTPEQLCAINKRYQQMLDEGELPSETPEKSG